MWHQELGLVVATVLEADEYVHECTRIRLHRTSLVVGIEVELISTHNMKGRSGSVHGIDIGKQISVMNQRQVVEIRHNVWGSACIDSHFGT